jgi:hypothetical protein
MRASCAKPRGPGRGVSRVDLAALRLIETENRTLAKRLADELDSKKKELADELKALTRSRSRARSARASRRRQAALLTRERQSKRLRRRGAAAESADDDAVAQRDFDIVAYMRVCREFEEMMLRAQE